MDLVAVLAQNIRERRYALGRTQEEVAEASGMHSAMFSRIERGEVNATVRSVARIAYALETTPAELLRDAERS